MITTISSPCPLALITCSTFSLNFFYCPPINGIRYICLYVTDLFHLLKFIHVAVYIKLPFFLKTGYLSGHVYHIMCTHALNEKSLVEGFYATNINQTEQ